MFLIKATHPGLICCHPMWRLAEQCFRACMTKDHIKVISLRYDVIKLNPFQGLKH